MLVPFSYTSATITLFQLSIYFLQCAQNNKMLHCTLQYMSNDNDDDDDDESNLVQCAQ